MAGWTVDGRRAPWLALLVLCTLLASACGDRSWQTKDISGLMPALEFELMADDGGIVRAEDVEGKIALMFFGYTHCPDVCPMTLSRLQAAANRIEPELRDELRILFVSVDPARDDPARLRRYTSAFGDHVLGLTGGQAALRELTRRYRVTYGYGEEGADGDYPVSHSSGVFAFDRDGEARLLIREGDELEAVVADLRRLIKAG